MKTARSRIYPPRFLFFSAQLMSGTAKAVILPILPIYMRELGFSIATLGIFTAGSGFALMIFEPLWGVWADKVGAKRIFVLTNLFTPLVLFSYTLVKDFGMFGALMFFSGVWQCAWVVSSRMLARTASTKGGRAFGAWYTIFAAAGLIGPAIGGYTAAIDYSLTFYVATVIALIAFLLSFGAPDSGRKHMPNEKDKVRGLNKEEKSILVVMSSLIILPMYLVAVSRTFLPVLAKEKLFLGPLEVSWIFTIMGILGLIAPLLFSELSDRIGMKTMILIGMLLQATSFLLFPVASGMMMLALTAVIFGLGTAGTNPLMMALLMERIPIPKQGFTLGAYGFCEDIGLTLGPLIVGYIYQDYGAEFPFYMTSGLMLFNLVLSIPLLRNIDRK